MKAPREYGVSLEPTIKIVKWFVSASLHFTKIEWVWKTGRFLIRRDISLCILVDYYTV